MYLHSALLTCGKKKTEATLVDEKDPLSFFLLSALTRLVLRFWYRKMEIWGLNNLPKSGPFICVANHSSRFDGPTLGWLINRPANFMVAPAELKGLQGALLKKVGAFPATGRLDFIEHTLERFEKGEPLVIFPEGNVFYDGVTHPFKKGFCRVAMAAAQRGMAVPIIPVGLIYGPKPRTLSLNFGSPIEVDDYFSSYLTNGGKALKDLANSTHREVLALRAQMGVELDQKVLLEPSFHYGSREMSGLQM